MFFAGTIVGQSIQEQPYPSFWTGSAGSSSLISAPIILKVNGLFGELTEGSNIIILKDEDNQVNFEATYGHFLIELLSFSEAGYVLEMLNA